MANSDQQISGDEFHRMQLQILELRTENYQLKDDNKKLKREYTAASQKEAKLEKEVSKQIKLRKAFTTLNKSKQAAEFEELLQQNEQAFILQNQTLAEELGKLQTAVKTLENENRQYKRQISLAPQDKAKDAEMRKLQAANTALKQSLDSLKQAKAGDMVDGTETTKGDKVESESKADDNVNTEEDDIKTVTKQNSKLLTKEGRSDSDADSQVQILTLQEEKRLLEFELDNAVKKHDSKINEITEAMALLQSKLDQKQKSCNSLQKDINELQTFKKSALDSSSKLMEEHEALRKKVDELSSENTALSKSVRESEIITKQQHESLEHWRKQVDAKDAECKALKLQNSQNSETLDRMTRDTDSSLSSLELLQKEKDELQARYEKSVSVGEALLNQHTNLERQMEQLQHELRQSKILSERQEEKLQDVAKYEREIEGLKTQVREALELAEKRKKVADAQSVESQEMVAKFDRRVADTEKSYEEKLNAIVAERDTKTKSLEDTIKAHEDELIRAHHQERAKTREIDGLQQKINDLTAESTSLENSRGWFERALRDAEKMAESVAAQQREEVDKLREDHAGELERAQAATTSKDDVIRECEKRAEVLGTALREKDSKISDLKRDVKDEVQKQRLVEKKVHAAMKDLKKQVVAERKKNDVLREKLKERSAGESNVEELLRVVDTTQQSNKPPSGGASSVSSFSFRDFMSPARPNATGSISPVPRRAASATVSEDSSRLSATETSDLLHRVAELQSEKWALEEKVRHLEESGGAMADELVEKSEMVQRYVQHTRSDSVKRNPDISTPKSLRDKVKSLVTGQDDQPQAGIGNIYELNKKLTRMLEEEMTKNMALKKDMELMALRLSER